MSTERTERIEKELARRKQQDANRGRRFTWEEGDVEVIPPTKQEEPPRDDRD